ncbi:tetraacyldisaccharide 4'-kinase [Candidatus Albibeggiatoa sp. nov. NOAA]|uniref:tetraacyldisaccharide 4'-kinase n=1 Tax=Candidatus Albibeggiatoa sp. nov. NOAA TaxID=3162724 RepID=UPI0032F4FB86|nr:tetraacyldisaccharide 4'-kinase [Thiotrichaceae bacterium]
MKLERIWYRFHFLTLFLVPFSWLFCLVVGLRRWTYRYLLRKAHFDVPIIIVGNINVGGTGKTPLVVWLAHFLKHHGYHVGIISRGYGSKTKQFPQTVRPSVHHPEEVGDEPFLLARRTGCPVTIDPKRTRGVKHLIEQHDCDLIISDDGLQHYALKRDIEIAVIDGERRYGNGFCLPAGPLREPPRRLKSVDFVIVKGQSQQKEITMHYALKPLRNVANENDSQPLGDFLGKSLHAVAGIGNPRPFFNILLDNQCKIRPHVFPDHHFFKEQDFDFEENLPIIMTEKDAVKCRKFAKKNYWYLPIEARLPSSFGKRLLEKLQEKRRG